jgi:hypothetical protein
MPINKFEKIRHFLLNQNAMLLPRTDSNNDRLHKLIRPIYGKLNQMFCKIPMEQRLCVNELMCSLKIGHYMKQYMPKKPNK